MHRLVGRTLTNFAFIKLFLLLLGLGSVLLIGEVDAETDSKEIPTLKSPKVIKRGPIEYPRRALSRNEEGWVELETMVDRNGHPYEIVVVDSVGHPAFRIAAIQSLKRATFEPAEYRGEKVDGVHRFKVAFSMHSGTRAYFRQFRALFTKTVKDVEAGDQTSARSNLEKLRDQTKTLHEDVMYRTARFYYEQKWGTPSEQLASLNKALGYRTSPGNMDARLFEQLLWSKLDLEIELGHYGESLRTINVLEQLEGLDDSSQANLVKYKNSIKDLRVADTAFGVPGSLDENGKWKYVLLRNEFAVTDVEGVLYEFQLYCERDLVRFKFEPELQYSLDGTNGTCSLWAIGKPNSEFTLLQL